MEPFQTKRRRILSDKILTFTRTRLHFTSVLNSFNQFQLQSNQFRLYPELIDIKPELHTGDVIFQVRNVHGPSECRTNLNGMILQKSTTDTSRVISEINENIHHEFWRNIHFCGYSLTENSTTTVVTGCDIYCTTRLPADNKPIKKSQLLFYYLPKLNSNINEYKFELCGLDPNTNIYPVKSKACWSQATKLLDFWSKYWTACCTDFQNKNGLRMFGDVNLKPLFDSVKSMVFAPRFEYMDYEDLRNHYELLEELNDTGKDMFEKFNHDIWKVSDFNVTCKTEHLLQLLFICKLFHYVSGRLGKEIETLVDYIQLYPWLIPADVTPDIGPIQSRISTHRIRSFVEQCDVYKEKSSEMLGHISDTLETFAGCGLHLARYGQKFKIRTYPTAFLF